MCHAKGPSICGSLAMHWHPCINDHNRPPGNARRPPTWRCASCWTGRRSWCCCWSTPCSATCRATTLSWVSVAGVAACRKHALPCVARLTPHCGLGTAVSSALVVASKLIGPDLVNAVLGLVTQRLTHNKESVRGRLSCSLLNDDLEACSEQRSSCKNNAEDHHPPLHTSLQVRKKAIMVLLHFHQLDVNRDGALAGVDFERPFRTALCDKDPSVMSAALCALQVRTLGMAMRWPIACIPLLHGLPIMRAPSPCVQEVMTNGVEAYKNLIPSFTSILKQV